jgi:signal peptidase II
VTATGRVAAVAIATVAVDQASKAIVRSAIEPGEEVGLLPGVELVNVRNRGIAFGLFSDGGALLVVFAALALAALLVFFARHRNTRLVWLPTGLLIGGAAGNLIDRARVGAVTDFVDVLAWPAFNLADVAITTGVLALLYVLEGPLRHERR